jgi:DNA-binding HxlR family transcriptional regulator
MELQRASKDPTVRADAPRYILGGVHDGHSRVDHSIDENIGWMEPWGDRVRATILVIGGKWKPLIIDVLKAGSVRSGALLRKIPQASRKVLTAQLRALEREKIVSRLVLGKRSEHVEYSLTPYGWTLVPALTAMAKWGATHLKAKGKNLSSGPRRVSAPPASSGRPSYQ